MNCPAIFVLRPKSMKKLLSFVLLFLVALNLQASCLPRYEQLLFRTIESRAKVTKIGKIATGSAFVTVGGFYGVMGVIMLEPLWAGAITGTLFGTVAALPVGTTFILVNQGQKARIKKLGRMISVLQGGEEFNLLLEDLRQEEPELTAIKLQDRISDLDEAGALCDGSMIQVGKMAGVKSLKRHLRSSSTGHLY
jgi:hypothetical protein